MEIKNEYEKIGASVVYPFKKNNRWVFKKDGQVYDMAPAQATEAALSPLVIGADRIISIGCKLKNIENPEDGFALIFSQEYFPNADVKFNLVEDKFNGWIYEVEELNLKGLLPGQSAWVCPYMILYYKEPPKTIYLKIEKKH